MTNNNEDRFYSSHPAHAEGVAWDKAARDLQAVLAAELVLANLDAADAFQAVAEMVREATGMNRSDAANHVMREMKAGETNPLVIEAVDLAATTYLLR